MENEEILSRIIFEMGLAQGEDFLNNSIETAAKRAEQQSMGGYLGLTQDVEELKKLSLGRFAAARLELSDGN